MNALDPARRIGPALLLLVGAAAGCIDTLSADGDFDYRDHSRYPD